MNGLMNKKISPLRGGGCGASRQSLNNQRNINDETQNIETFIKRFHSYVEVISSKATVSANQQESQEIMIAIQWFIFQEENIYQLSKNHLMVLKSYNLILEGIRRLLKSCLIYIRSDQFKCFYILQITASLSKVVFSFHMMNDERFMKCELQKEFLDICDELKQQIQIEKNDLIQVQMELYIFLTKTSFEIAPNNSKEKEEILKGCLSGIIISITQMKPSDQLLESLFQGACLLYKMHSINKIRAQYEVYFQIDMLQWEIISHFKKEKSKNLEEVILKIQAIHDNLVKNSNNWKNHYLWIQMIGKIVVYNPLLSLQKLNQLANSYKLEGNLKQIWKDYQNMGLIILMNHSNDLAVIQLDQFQNKQLFQLDRIMLQEIFKDWHQFLLLKEFLLNEQNQNLYFTFSTYLQNKLKISFIEYQENDYIQAVNRIQNFFEFIIPNKTVSLIRENYEKFGTIIQAYKNLILNRTIFNEKIKQTMQIAKINMMIHNLTECIQNNQYIFKIIKLNLRKENYQSNQLEQKNEINKILQLKYLIQLLESIFEQFIQESQQKPNEQQNQKNYEANQILEIQTELAKVKLKNQWLDNFRLKLMTILTSLLNQKNCLKQVSSLLNLIKNSWIEFGKSENLEISSLLNGNHLIEYIQTQLDSLYVDYSQVNQEFETDNREQMSFLKQIFTIKYKFEAFLNIKDLEQIEFIEHLQNLRFKHLKLHLKLDNIKKIFFTILAQANQLEVLQLQEFINLDEYMHSVVQKYPIKMNCFNSTIDQLITIELKCVQFTKQDYQNKLSEQKGQIEYLLFQIQLEEQMLSTEESDLQLIYNESGELFIQQFPSQRLVEKIIEGLKVNELLKQVSDKYFILSELKKEKGNFENSISQLKQIKDSYKQQNRDQAEFDYCNQLIIHIQKVIETLGTFESLHNDIFKILIKNDLINLTKLIEEKDQNQINNQNIENQGNQQADKIIILEDPNKLDLFNKEDLNTHLSFIIKALKLQLLKIKEYKQLLQKLLQEIITFSGNLGNIQSYEKDVQNECFQIFQCLFQQFVTNFEQIAITKNNLQQNQEENFLIYFERMTYNLTTEQNKTEITQSLINISDFLKSLKLYLQKKLSQLNYFTNTSINQEFMILQIRKLYQLDNQQEDQQSEGLGLIAKLNLTIQDYKNNDEWKIKQGLVFTIIQISSNCLTDTIVSFCQRTLIQLWVLEKDQRIRNLLKNEKLINFQMQILKKDWQTQHDRVAGEMQQMLKKIDQLQEQITHEANLNKRDLQLKEIDETTQQLDEYIQNISEMGQKLTLITDFVNHLRKNLLRVEGKINEMKDQLNNMGNDIKFLRGKSVEQLLEIRKWKVLKEAAYINVKSIYVPLKTQEKGQKEQSILMNIEQFDDRVAEVNDFLQQEDKTVLLIHGIAGSGKSTTSKKIEEFIWKLHENNKKIRNQVLIPIYISLPSLKNPVFQAVEDTLLQDDYGFDNLQLKECKEKLEKREFRFLLIMDSYDEMKLENISKNLYLNNKIKQNWSDPLVIFTTRSEIFTSINYIDWFAPEEKNKCKEVQLLKFDKEQTKIYLKKFTLLSIKMLIFDTYELQMQINKGNIDINKFEIFWEKLKSQFFEQNNKTDFLLNKKQILNILAFLKDEEFIALKSEEALRGLSINFEKLWSVQKYENMMKQINSNKLVETPYMMEIIVQVLPYMMTKAQDIIKMKSNFIKNFSTMFKDFLKSNYLIQTYKQQQKKHLKDLTDQIQDDQLIITRSDIQNLKKINYHQISLQVWEKLEMNSITKQLQISQDRFYELFIDKLEPITLLLQNTYDKIQIKNESIISLIFSALKEQNLRTFDFYSEFINYHYYRQIEKQKTLGKSINIDRYLLDLQIYSIKFAKFMSKNEITQVQYKHQGLQYKEEGEDDLQLDEFFNDDGQNGSYKKDIRSCSLVQKKGANYSFVHKSIQEFLIAADLYLLLILAEDLEVRILKSIIKRFQRELIQDQDCYQFLQKLDPFELDIQIQNLFQFERQQKQNNIQKQINQIIYIVEKIKKHDFNVINYSTEFYKETRKYLIQKISQDNQIIELLKFLVQITKIDQSFVQSGSNSLNLLVEMKVNLTKQNFSNIIIQNTSILGGSFARCNLSGSKLQNVNINGINLNGTQLFNCIWKDLKINELFQLDGHNGGINSVCFSSDGTTLASGSNDKSIQLWDIKTGQQKAKLDGHGDMVSSVCFSQDGTMLASGSNDKTIRLWDLKTGQLQTQLDHGDLVITICFSPNGIILASGGQGRSIRIWDVKTGSLKAQINGKSKYILSVVFSPDGAVLASGHDKSISLWDAKTGQEKAQLNGHDNLIRTICFSPDGNTLSSGSNDSTIRLWDIKTLKQKAQLNGHSNDIFSVCFSPQGAILASSSADKSIRLWDVETGQQKSQLDYHSDFVFSVCFSPDGTILASGGADKSMRLWDVKTSQINPQMDGHRDDVKSVRFSPDGIILASCSLDKYICLWNVKTGQQKAQLNGHYHQTPSVCFTQDGTTLVSVGCGRQDRSLHFWDVKTGLQKDSWNDCSAEGSSLEFSPDGTTLACGSYDKSIRLWDFKSGYQKLQLIGHRDGVTSICFSHDGTTLASGSYDKSIRLWDLMTGQQKAQIDDHNSSVNQLCVSLDGNTLASCSFDKTIRLWDFKTGNQTSQLDGHSDNIQSICFSPDGTTLASCSFDQSIRLWDINTGRQKDQLNVPNTWIYSVCFSPDGTKLASGSNDKTIRLWDIETAVQIYPQDQKNEDYQQFNAFLNSNSFHSKVPSYVIIQMINQQPIFQAQAALLLKGQFYNQLGIDLTTLFKQKGSYLLQYEPEVQQTKM